LPVQYVTYGRNRVKVSRYWNTVLRAADDDGVAFTVTSGHRTEQEQQRLFDQNMIRPGVPKKGRPLTAVPNRNAPHIRTGRANHALDIDSLDGGEARFERWIESQGARIEWINTVRGEPWHGEVSREDLERLARKFRARARRRRAKPKPKPKPRRPPTKLNAAGIRHLIEFEGEVLHAYNDPAGHATFGVGHLLHRGRCTAADFRKFGSKQRPLPREQARKLSRELLADDVARFERAVVRHVPLRWRGSHDRFNALVSLAFNLGEEILTPAPPLQSVGEALRGRSARAVAAAILLFDKAGGRTLPGLARRRRAERALFLRNK
jgi:GH24 family phage-related lysozyme (muramidase)